MNNNQKKLSSILMIILVAGLCLSACVAGQIGLKEPTPTAQSTVVESSRLTAEGSLLPVRSTVLGFITNGKLNEIRVSEGQEVHKGDVLASLQNQEALDATLRQAELEELSAQKALDDLNRSADLLHTQSARALLDAQNAYRDAQKALDHLNTTAFKDELNDRNDAINDAKDELDDAQETLDSHKDEDPDGSVFKDAQKKYDDAKLKYDDAIYDRDVWQGQLDQAGVMVDLTLAQLNEAQRVADAHRDGPDTKDLELAQSRLNAAKAQVTTAQKALDDMILTAPYDGIVAKVSDLDTGEIVTAGSMVMILADYSTWVVETHDLSELDVVTVKVGQKVTVIPDALPGLKLAGTIQSVDMLFSTNRTDVVYTVHIRLDEVDPQLRWGMTVIVTFE